MPKFSGVVGFAETVTVRPGVKVDQISEKPYFGDVIRNSRGLQVAEQVVPDLTVGNSISIVADEYAHGHIFAMRYVKWRGVLWIVSNVDVEPPRLVLRLGGVYNGPLPA